MRLSKLLNWDQRQTQAAANDETHVSTGGDGGMSDEQILDLMFNANNGQTVQSLYQGDTSRHVDDQSSADLALVNHIAFYTQNPEQIDRIFRQSKLYRRKWDKVHSADGQTYGEMTIQKALDGLTDTYTAPSTSNAPRKAKSTGREFRLIPASEIIKRSVKIDWVIQDFIPSGSVVQIFGKPASGKSLIALDMACCIGSGQNWAGKPVKQGSVAYIAGEGFNGLSKRLNALIQGKGLSVDHLYCSESSMDLMRPESVEEVLSTVEGISDLRIIVIDTLHRNFSGDENSARDFSRVLQHCDQMKFATEATIILVHHTGHGDGKRARGSSSIYGGIDVEYKVEKKSSEVNLVNTKMKDAELQKPINFKLETVVIGIEDGKDITGPILKKVFANADKSFPDNSPTLNPVEQLTLDILRLTEDESTEPVSKSNWMSACKEKYTVSQIAKNPDEAKRRKFERNIKTLIEDGLVVEDNGCFSTTGSVPDTGAVSLSATEGDEGDEKDD